MSSPVDPTRADDPLSSRFEIIERYGGGGQGATALVRDRKNGQARRILKWIDSTTIEAVRETALLAGLSHPRIPALIEAGTIESSAGSQAFLLRDYAPGRMFGSAPSDPQDLLAQTRDLLETLAFVHRLGFVHGDVKPANLIVDGAEVHLIDFGLASRSGEAGNRGGTPIFAAPERPYGATARTDLYGVGMTLLAALVDLDAHVGTLLREVPGREALEVLGIEAESLPTPFDRLLPSLLAVDPERRCFDATEALELLVGSAGRPHPSSLRLDPHRLWPEISSSLGVADFDVLVLSGGDPESRRTFAFDSLRKRAATGSVEERDQTCRVTFGSATDPKEQTLELGAPEAGVLADSLKHLLGLDPTAAAEAAAVLRRTTDGTRIGIERRLQQLLANGQLLPHGAGFHWPDAQAGRFEEPNAHPRPTDPDELYRLLLTGAVESAEETLRNALADRAEDSAAWRRACSRGLLDMGEPARALPWTFDLPLERARAICDLGEIDEAEKQLRLLDRSTLSGLEDRDRLAVLEADLLSHRGEHDRAMARLGDCGTRTPLAGARRAALELRRGAPEDALAETDRVLDSLSDHPGTHLGAIARGLRGEALRRLGRFEEAIEELGRARDAHRSQGHLRQVAAADLNLGVALKEIGRLDEALAHQRRAATAFRYVGDRHSASVALLNTAILAIERGDHHNAKARLDDVERDLRRLGHAGLDGFAKILRARIQVLAGRSDKARELIEEVREESLDPRARRELELVREMTESRPRDEATRGLPWPIFRTFLALNRRLAMESDPDAVLRQVLDAAVQMTGAREAYLLVERDDVITTERHTKTGHGPDRAFSRSLANRAIHEGRTIDALEALQDRELKDMASVQNLDQRSALCAPFHGASGLRGAVYIEHAGRASAFGSEEAELLEAVADQAAIALERTRVPDPQDPVGDVPHPPRAARRSRRAPRMLGRSRAVDRLRQEITKLAPSPLPVLVLGETGSGKELVAESLHAQGRFADRPFVSENCSAIPSELIESELFGHVKGAFTGADRDRAGLFEQAHGGTLFLDEIGDMPSDMQAKLLRALQNGEVRRVGGREPIAVDIRLVTATHKDLEAMVRTGEFREDLYFRIAASVIRVPPLRERGDDVLLLAKNVLDGLRKTHGREIGLDEQTAQRLRDYDWPGNIRELQHVLTRAYVLADGDELDPDQLPLRRETDVADERAWPALSLEEATRRTIRAALRRTDGDKTKAAKLLGMSRTALYDRLRRDPDLQ